jgi:hypothetical protein
MKKYLFIYAVLTTVVIVVGGRILWGEQQREKSNNQALLQSVNYYKTEAEKSAASVQILRLRCGEFEELRAADAEKIRQMGLKIRRLESAANSVTQTKLEVVVPIRDTVVIRDTVKTIDTLRLFRWQDNWVTIDGVIDSDSVACTLRSVDTLHQVVYRVPRRFWFIKFGTKALRQHIMSSNPHSEIVYTEYVKIEK